MTDRKKKNFISALAALALTFAVCAVFALVGTAEERDTSAVETTERPSSVAETEEPAEQSESKTGREARTTTQRESRTNPYRTTETSSQSSSDKETATTASENNSVNESEISSTGRSSLTGVQRDYNRTSYYAASKSRDEATYTTVNTGMPEITSELYAGADATLPEDWSGFSFDFTTIPTETGESEEREAAEAEDSFPYRKAAVAFGVAAVLLILSGAAFALWYLKEEKAKKEQQDLYKF